MPLCSPFDRHGTPNCMNWSHNHLFTVANDRYKQYSRGQGCGQYQKCSPTSGMFRKAPPPPPPPPYCSVFVLNTIEQNSAQTPTPPWTEHSTTRTAILYWPHPSYLAHYSSRFQKPLYVKAQSQLPRIILYAWLGAYSTFDTLALEQSHSLSFAIRCGVNYIIKYRSSTGIPL